MVYFINETSTLLNLSRKREGNKSTIVLNVDDSKLNEVELLSTTCPDITEAIERRYSKCIEINQTPFRDYVNVNNSVILINNDNELVDLGKNREKAEEGSTYIKNIVVLVINPESRFYVDKRNLVNKPRLFRGNDVTVAVFQIKHNNWFNLKNPLNILIKSAFGEDYNMKINMTYGTKTADNGKEKKFNQIVLEKYTGTYPTFNKPVGDRPARNYETKATDTSKPKFDKTRNYSKDKYHNGGYNPWKDDEDHYNTKKDNGHKKKKKRK